jgi:hypothetical protein
MCLKIHVLYVLDSEAACSSTPMATRLMADDVSTSTSHRFLAYLDLATGQTTINDVATSLGRSSAQLTCKKLHRQMSVSTVDDLARPDAPLELEAIAEPSPEQ